jgi:predicted nucleic acid-binding protein
VADAAVINASPLIFLSRSGNLELLHGFAKSIWLPEPVFKEILARGSNDPTVQAVQQTAWLIERPVTDIPIEILEWRLGKGESSVLALAMESNNEAIIDDLQGRKCAASLNIPVRGTLGIVLTAKRREMIPAARPVIEDMMKAGLYLSKKVLDQALAKVGE